MKSKHLLSALLSTTLIFAACGNESADKTEDKPKTEDTKSYHAVLDTTMTADGKDTTVNMDMNVDDKGTTQITTESMGQKMDMYIFDKKVVMSPDSKTFMDVTKAMGARVQKQLEQLDYATALNSLDGYKDAEFKETADGYSLTKKFKNLAEYKKIAEQTGSQELISSIEKQVEDVKGEAVINFDKDYMMKTTETKVDMTIKDKKIATETKANYDNYDKVPAITVPTAAKSAKPLEEVQKEMQDKMNSSSTETSTETK